VDWKAANTSQATEALHVAKLSLFNVRLLWQLEQARSSSDIDRLVSDVAHRSNVSLENLSLLHQAAFLEFGYVTLVWLYERAKADVGPEIDFWSAVEQHLDGQPRVISWTGNRSVTTHTRRATRRIRPASVRDSKASASGAVTGRSPDRPLLTSLTARYISRAACTLQVPVYTGCVKRTIVEIDEDLLAEATDILHAASMKEAVNEALRFVVTEKRRRQAEAIDILGDWFAERPFEKDEAWR
jgi:Arc/MetJ family transcription regulator